MSSRAQSVAAQLDLLGLDDARLGEAGRAVGLGATQVRERWQGARLPCAGEAHLRCVACGLGASVRFRCAGRCDHECEHKERAAAALLRVIPRVPVRHWVLTLPGALRTASAVDQRLVRELSREFISKVFAFVRGRSDETRPIQCGAVSLVHRAARALVLDVHVHALVLDGGYVATGRGPDEFVPMEGEPSVDELAALCASLREALLERWRRRRATAAGDELWRIAVEQSLAVGPVAATAVRRIKVQSIEGVETIAPARSRRVGIGAQKDGLGVHVMERIDGAARGSLAALARYLVRAPVALADLEPGKPGRVVHRLARPFADGSTHVEFSTDELARRLVALSPTRHVHRVSYHGALAPGAAAKWRARPLQLVLVDGPRIARVRRKPPRGRASPGDPPECGRCGGPLRVVAIDESVDPAAPWSTSGSGPGPGPGPGPRERAEGG